MCRDLPVYRPMRMAHPSCFCFLFVLCGLSEHSEQAVQIQEEAELLLTGAEYEVSSAHVLSLVNQSSCPAYTGAFVALARQLNVPLVTQDKKLLSQFPAITIGIDSCSNRTP